jgi:cytoskeletal protein CcmA (bactofilin family)
MAQASEPGRNGGSADNVAAISKGIRITGNVEAEGALQICGRVEGEIRCATVFVDEGGVVEGAIIAQRLRVSGHANGAIQSNDLAIEAGGMVSGDVTYERIKIAAGGLISGSFTHRASEQAPESDSALKLVTPPDANPRRIYVD